MISPYKGKFKVTQIKHKDHDGLDLVGIDGKNLYATANGTVVHADWEDPKDHKKGFGQYVVIRALNNDYYFYGHVSEFRVKSGQEVKVGDLIAVEGNTGRSTGSHCHYCIRYNRSKAAVRDVSAISGIPNKLGVYGEEEKPHGVVTLRAGTWNVRTAPSLGAPVARVVKGPQSVTYVNVVSERDPKNYGSRKFYLLRDGCYISVNACN